MLPYQSHGMKRISSTGFCTSSRRKAAHFYAWLLFGFDDVVGDVTELAQLNADPDCVQAG